MNTFLFYFTCIIGGIIGILILLWLTCIFYYFFDPFEMKAALRWVNELCRKNSNDALEGLTDVLVKMDTCPEIGNYIAPIFVYGITYRLRAYVVGDKCGKPRFFVIDKKSRSDSEFYKITESKKFKRYGLYHSITKEKLREMLNEASKVRYKKDLEEKQYNNIKNHFK